MSFDLHVEQDTPKSLREVLCAAQSAVGNSIYDQGQREHRVKALQRLINEIDKHRPLGVDGKHGNRHTPTCGCEDVPETDTKTVFLKWAANGHKVRWGSKLVGDFDYLYVSLNDLVYDALRLSFNDSESGFKHLINRIYIESGINPDVNSNVEETENSNNEEINMSCEKSGHTWNFNRKTKQVECMRCGRGSNR